jgi:hypothetical protein
MGINIVMEPIKRSQCNVCPSFIDVVKECWNVYRFRYNGKSSVRGCGRAFTSIRELIHLDYLTPSHTGLTVVVTRMRENPKGHVSRLLSRNISCRINYLTFSAEHK